MRKLSLVLAILLALCVCAFAETETSAPAPADADILGLWTLDYAVADGMQVSAKAYGLMVTLSFGEDGSAVMDYGDGNPVEMSWRIEDGIAWITGYSAEDVQLTLAEDGGLVIEDEIGVMRFSRPQAETEAE